MEDEGVVVEESGESVREFFCVSLRVSRVRLASLGS